VEEISAILIHSAIYAGIPSGVEAFNAAKEVLGDMGLDK
jgi:alkylhydroperoxidase/carboxymuconolactone decarboxylase family protein YurZ